MTSIGLVIAARSASGADLPTGSRNEGDTRTSSASRSPVITLSQIWRAASAEGGSNSTAQTAQPRSFNRLATEPSARYQRAEDMRAALADTATPEMNAKLDAVKWDMLEEWSKTKRAPKHAAFLHQKEFRS